MSVVRRLSDRRGDPGLRYRKLFETMSEGFVICQVIRDPDGKLIDYWIREANPAFLKHTPGGTPVQVRLDAAHLIFAHPASRYFRVGRLGRDQIEDYAVRRNLPLAEVERWLRPNLAYDPS